MISWRCERVDTCLPASDELRRCTSGARPAADGRLPEKTQFSKTIALFGAPQANHGDSESGLLVQQNRALWRPGGRAASFSESHEHQKINGPVRGWQRAIDRK